MTNADPPRVKVGVVLPPPVGDLGQWLAEGAAFEAAGADALWLDVGGEVDPVAVTAALAAVTYRSRLLAVIPDHVSEGARDTLDRLSRGRLAAVPGEGAAVPGEGGAVPSEGGAVPGEGEAVSGEVGAVRGEGAAPDDGWLRVPVPENRAAWRATLGDAVEREAAGVLVPADPRLLDLLRNPDEVVDRQDLHIAQG